LYFFKLYQKKRRRIKDNKQAGFWFLFSEYIFSEIKGYYSKKENDFKSKNLQ
jgi:hypothetical protein